MNTIKVRPVLLPINYIGATLTLYHDGKGNYPQLSTNLDKLQYHTNQELLLISLEDDEIEENDIVIWKSQLFTVNSNKAYSNTNNITVDYCNQFKLPKVIARQSQISPEYIPKFIEQYNNGSVEDLEIEMNIITMQQSSERYEDNDILVNGEIVESIDYTLEDVIDKTIEKYNKPKLTNGFVTIVEKEPILYTEEEVKDFLGRFGHYIMTHPDLDMGEEFEEAIYWLNQNKKK